MRSNSVRVNMSLSVRSGWVPSVVGPQAFSLSVEMAELDF